jgi:hypothetical protein
MSDNNNVLGGTEEKCLKKQSVRKSVRFDQVHVREYAITIGVTEPCSSRRNDNDEFDVDPHEETLSLWNSTSSSFPLELDWAHTETKSYSINHHQRHRQQQRRQLQQFHSIPVLSDNGRVAISFSINHHDEPRRLSVGERRIRLLTVTGSGRREEESISHSSISSRRMNMHDIKTCSSTAVPDAISVPATYNVDVYMCSFYQS